MLFVAKTVKTRRYIDLEVISALLYVGAVLYAGAAVLLVVLAGTGRMSEREFNEAFWSAGWCLGVMLLNLCIAGSIRLARHVADDVYVIRLIAQNYWRERNQGPP